MNKVKMFFVAAALVLTTAGVFAGKAKFAGNAPLNLWYDNAGTKTQITSAAFGSASIFEYGTPVGSQVTFTNQGGTAYPLYTLLSGGVYKEIYSTF